MGPLRLGIPRLSSGHASPGDERPHSWEIELCRRSDRMGLVPEGGDDLTWRGFAELIARDLCLGDPVAS